ncbi:Mpo1-like protein [Yunchengibacter salinarum]|uniref:Mpo1-like protein n=1 Tax=Yunchengibacter salinarum TaxID=3133399 RepID=UPI0035B5F0A7
MAAPAFDSFRAFFPYYLAEHANPTCRRLHYAGTTLGSAVALYAVITQTWALLLLYPVIGYGFAWVGHYRFEHNRPATFDYPLWSLMGDYKMLALAATGRLKEPLMAGIRKHGKQAH